MGLPAHTPVPEYIRLIAEGRYSDAYMINWRSNVFPGILGRTCDRPCEPACAAAASRRLRLRSAGLKRVAADFKDDVKDRMPRRAAKNGKAHRHRRRRPRLPDRRPRPGAARLSLHRVRSDPKAGA